MRTCSCGCGASLEGQKPSAYDEIRAERDRYRAALETLRDPKVEEYEASAYVRRMAAFARDALDPPKPEVVVPDSMRRGTGPAKVVRQLRRR